MQMSFLNSDPVKLAKLQKQLDIFNTVNEVHLLDSN